MMVLSVQLLGLTARISKCDMDVQLLSGGTVRLRLNNKKIRTKERSKSNFQYKIGQRLVEQYPHDVIFEEVVVKGDGFILDFFIPSLKLVVECNGRQHREQIKFFHRTRRDFHKQQETDQKKRDWCKLNGFKLVEVYDE